MEQGTMMSHDRSMDPVAMGYAMSGSNMSPTPMTMNPVMSGGYGGSMQSPTINPHAQSPMGGYGGHPAQRPHRIPAHLSAVQMKLLTYQMKAYRCLAQSKPIPEPIRNLILSHATGINNRSVATPPPSSVSPAPPTTVDTTPSQSFQSSAVTKPSLTPPTQKQNTTPTSNQSTNSIVGGLATGGGDRPREEGKGNDGNAINKSSTAQLKQMKLAPVAKPKGLDPDVIMKERETRYLG